MSRRIDIELTSALGDGTWTWRAAGARQPKGVVDRSVLPADVKVGDELKVDVEQELEGITVLGVVDGRQKTEPDVIELLPAERDFQPVVETRAKRDRNDRGRGRDGDRGPRRDRDGRGGGPRRDGGGRGDGRGDGRGREGGGRGDGRGREGGGRGDGRRRDGGGGGRRGPSFTPPPEVPQRPKAKRLRPGKAHRNTVLAELPEEQRAIAELALQGMGAVRQRVREENEKAVADGRPPMPEASVMKIAEDLVPKLRLAEWHDRAEAAQRQMEHLDLRDLRSVIAAAGDPTVARDEGSTALVAELKESLVHKQEQELVLWFGDVDAALAVGRVIRALRLSSQPPKAGVPFPIDIAKRLVESVNASLAPMDSPERWAAMLEAAAFSPVRSLVKPLRKPDVVNDELLATVKRLAPALPQIAALFEIEVDPKAPMPKPLRPNHGGKDARRKDGGGRGGNERRPKRSDGGKGDRPKADHDKARKPKTDEAKTDEAKVDEAKVDEAKASSTPVEAPADATVDAPAEAAAESAPADAEAEAPAEAVAQTEAPVEAPAVPEAAVEAPAVPEAAVEAPAVPEAVVEAPAVPEAAAEAVAVPEASAEAAQPTPDAAASSAAADTASDKDTSPSE